MPELRRLWLCVGLIPARQLRRKAGRALPNDPFQGSFVGRVPPRLKSDIGSKSALIYSRVMLLTSWLLSAGMGKVSTFGVSSL